MSSHCIVQSCSWQQRLVQGALVLLLAVLAHAAQAAEELSAAEQGRDLFETNCMTCHGANMVNPGTVSYDLRKFPADAKPRFVNSVTNGKGQCMPAWRGVIEPAEIDLLWAYVLTRGKL